MDLSHSHLVSPVDKRHGLGCLKGTHIFSFNLKRFPAGSKMINEIHRVALNEKSNKSLALFHFLLFLFFLIVRLLSVLRGHWFFSSPPQRPMTSDLERFSIPDFIHYIYFPILILEKEPVFPFLIFSGKQGNYLVPFL